MEPRFEQFIRERQYLHNVSPATLEWHRHSLKWLPNESPSESDLKDMVMRMRNKGRKATGCNCVIRSVNAYLRWSGSALKIPQLKEEQFIPPTFTEAQVSRIVRYRPKGFCQRRLHLLTLLLLDTGCRISEAMGVRVRDVDMDNLLVTLDGKGRKQRMVPISFELRKVIFRFVTEFSRKPDWFLFTTRHGTRLERRDTLRDVKLLCRSLGFEPPPRTNHAFRHTFAVNYLRRGGSVFHLQKCLGHSSLEMTRRYANLVTEDLQKIHERISLLTR